MSDIKFTGQAATYNVNDIRHALNMAKYTVDLADHRLSYIKILPSEPEILRLDSADAFRMTRLEFPLRVPRQGDNIETLLHPVQVSDITKTPITKLPKDITIDETTGEGIFYPDLDKIAVGEQTPLFNIPTVSIRQAFRNKELRRKDQAFICETNRRWHIASYAAPDDILVWSPTDAVDVQPFAATEKHRLATQCKFLYEVSYALRTEEALTVSIGPEPNSPFQITSTHGFHMVAMPAIGNATHWKPVYKAIPDKYTPSPSELNKQLAMTMA